MCDSLSENWFSTQINTRILYFCVVQTNKFTENLEQIGDFIAKDYRQARYRFILDNNNVNSKRHLDKKIPQKYMFISFTLKFLFLNRLQTLTSLELATTIKNNQIAKLSRWRFVLFFIFIADMCNLNDQNINNLYKR